MTLDLFGDDRVGPPRGATILITGSRVIERDQARSLLDEHLGGWLGKGNQWILGGARGLDHWAMEWLLENGEQYCVVVPFQLDDQPAVVHEVVALARDKVELHLPRSKSAFIQRNQYMVDRAAIVVGFWDGASRGTAATLNYARKKGKQVSVWKVDL